MDVDNVELAGDAVQSQFKLPLEVDVKYSIGVCTEGCIGVAWDHMQKHLNAIMEDLKLDRPTLSLYEWGILLCASTGYCDDSNTSGSYGRRIEDHDGLCRMGCD